MLATSLRPFIAFQAVSLLVSQTYLIALSTAITPMMGEATFGLLYALDLFIRAFTMALSGFFIDAIEQRRLGTMLDTLMASGFAVLAWGVWAHSLPLVCVGIGLGAITSSLVPAIIPAVLTRTVPEPHRHTALADWRTANVVATITGPMLAAITIPLLGPVAALLLTSVVVGLLTTSHYLMLPKPSRPPDQSQPQQTVLQQALSGYVFAFTTRGLRELLLLDIVHVVYPVSLWLLIVQSPDKLGIQPGTQGWLIGAFSIGGVCGTLLARKCNPRNLLGWIVIFQLFFTAPLVLIGYMSSLGMWIVVPAIVFGGLGNEASSVWMSSFISHITPKELVGRVFAVNMLSSVGMMPLGILACTFLVRTLPLPLLTSIAGVILVASSATCFALVRKSPSRSAT